MHLIDVENLAGTGAPGPIQVRDLRARYVMLVGVGAMDQIVIASSHLALKQVGCWWLGARYLIRSGPDGADLELLDLIDREHIAARFSRVMIASGDGRFVPAAAALAVAGCQVTVVSRRASLSKRLALAAGWEVVYIDTPHTSMPASVGRPPDVA